MAIEYLSNAIKLQPDVAQIYMIRGFDYAHLGQYQSAIEDFNQFIRLKPDDDGAYSSRPAAYGLLGQYQRAIEDYNEAIRLKPNFVWAYGNRAATFFMQRNKKLGCREAQKACTLGNCKLLKIAKGKGDCR